MAYSEKLKLLFVHIPKTAGTSIIEAMRQKDPTVNHGHIPWSGHYTYGNVKSFTIVRNPWDRAFSCYNYAIKEESYWHGKGKKYGIHPDYRILKDYGFKDAIKILYNNKWVLDEPINRRPNFKDNWSYQYPFVYDTFDTLKVDTVYDYSEIDDVIKWLSEDYGLDVPKLNVSNNGESYKDFYDNDTIEMVGEIYSKDIDLFDYGY